MAESMFFDFHRHYGTDIRVARIFNTYGPGMQINDGRVISNFVVQALRNEDITVYGDGHQTRCFCYVSDTVDGLVRLMNKEGITGPINIGNPHEFTVLETANIIMRKVNSSSHITHKEFVSDDPTRRCPVITAAKTALDWAPLVEFEDGLESTIRYFQTII